MKFRESEPQPSSSAGEPEKEDKQKLHRPSRVKTRAKQLAKIGVLAVGLSRGIDAPASISPTIQRLSEQEQKTAQEQLIVIQEQFGNFGLINLRAGEIRKKVNRELIGAPPVIKNFETMDSMPGLTNAMIARLTDQRLFPGGFPIREISYIDEVGVRVKNWHPDSIETPPPIAKTFYNKRVIEFYKWRDRDFENLENISPERRTKLLLQHLSKTLTHEWTHAFHPQNNVHLSWGESVEMAHDLALINEQGPYLTFNAGLLEQGIRKMISKDKREENFNRMDERLAIAGSRYLTSPDVLQEYNPQYYNFFEKWSSRIDPTFDVHKASEERNKIIEEIFRELLASQNSQ